MKITSDLKLYALAKIVTVFSWVAIIKIFTQNLTAAEYGNYSLIYTLLVLISAGSTVWITTSFVRFYPEALQKNKLAAFNYLGSKATLPSMAVGLCLLLSVLAVLFYLNILQLTLSFYLLISMCFIGHMIFLLSSAYLSAAREIKRYVLLVSSQIFLYVSISAFLFVNSELNISAVFLGLLISYTPLVFAAKSPKELFKNASKFTKRFNTKGLDKYRQYGFPILFMSISIQLNSVADQYILKFYQMHDEVGMYAAFYTLSEKSLFIVYQLLSISALPIAFRYWEQGEKKRSYVIFWQIILTYVIVGLSGIAVLLYFGHELTSLLIDESYMAGIYIMPFVLAGVFLGGCAALFSDVLLLKKQTLLLAKCYIFAAIINIILNFFLIPHHGMIGAAVATLISYSIIFLLLIFNLKSKTKMFKILIVRRNDRLGE
jgi:O-antigen/teichoic acid export membrane protein